MKKLKFSNQEISKWLFFLFIFFLPWQTRLILLPHQLEYLSFSIYLSEIFLWLALSFWLVEDYKKIKLSGFLLFFYFFIFLSLIWTENKIAGFRMVLYIFEGILVFTYLKQYKENIKPAMNIFLVSLIVVSALAFYQFFNLSSSAFKWLGLANRSAWNLGDIVVDIGKERWLRAYGPFPHPNILGGYLAAGIMFLFFGIKNKTISKSVYYFLGGIFIFALIITFSRSAWLGLLFSSTYFIFRYGEKKRLRKFTFFSLALIAVLYIIFNPFISSRIKSSGRLENKSNIERMASWKEGIEIWKENIFFGTGIGNYIINAPSADDTKQPAHNLYILILAELGLAGFLIYFFFLRKIWQIPNIKHILVLFLVIGLFDHYLWTLYSGQMLFWVGISMSLQEN